MLKSFIVIFSFCSIVSFSQNFRYQPEVESASVDVEKQEITVTVKHGGGCKDHKYILEMTHCLESYPVQCTAKIYDTVLDPCEALLVRDAVFTFEELGLNDSYFNGATINIGGENNTSASIKLPFKEE